MTNKTVTHKGNIYQIGAMYEFSNAGTDWFPDVFNSMDGIDGTDFCGNDDAYEFIREVQATIGTIEKAPIELEDGCYYAFTEESSSHMIEHLGRFDKDSSNILCGGGFSYQRHNEYFEASTIKVLYEMAKVENK